MPLAKHDRAAQEKRERNAAYAAKYRQRTCFNKACRHKSCRRGRCVICGDKTK